MYSRLVVRAAPKGAEHYKYFVYLGRTLEVPYRGVSVPLVKGQRIGVRKSSDKKHIRLIFGDEANRVFTLGAELAAKIAKKVKVMP